MFLGFSTPRNVVTTFCPSAFNIGRRFIININNAVTLSRRFLKIPESIGANDQNSAKQKFFDEINDPLDNVYVGLLTDGFNGAYGYSDVEPSEETKRAACQALAEFIY